MGKMSTDGSSISRNGCVWSPDDLLQLRQLAASGSSVREIAAALQRTRVGVKSKASSLGIAIRPLRTGKRVTLNRERASRSRDKATAGLTAEGV